MEPGGVFFFANEAVGVSKRNQIDICFLVDFGKRCYDFLKLILQIARTTKDGLSPSEQSPGDRHHSTELTMFIPRGPGPEENLVLLFWLFFFGQALLI